MTLSDGHTNPRADDPSDSGDGSGDALSDFAQDLDASVGFGHTGEGAGSSPLSDSNARHLRPGTVVSGRYVVQSLLGRGGMGAVYCVTDQVLGRDIALKVMLPSLLARPKAVRRFQQEAELMLALTHPGIVRVYDVGFDTERGIRYFTMELLVGLSLREWIRAQQACEGAKAEDALAITGQILEALTHAHQTTIHRDLKPENVFLVGGDPKRIKILDFGIAKIQEAEDFTRTNVALGTFGYMAPEQRHDAATVDRRADLYSVSVMLYEMLTGDLPMGAFRTPTQERPELPAAIDPMIERGLQPKPDRRYDSARTLLLEVQAIRRALEGGDAGSPGRGGDMRAAVAAGAPAAGGRGQLAVKLLVAAVLIFGAYLTHEFGVWGDHADPTPTPTPSLEAVVAADGTPTSAAETSAAAAATREAAEAAALGPPRGEAPTIRLTAPAEGMATNEDSVEVVGEVTGTELRKLTVGGQPGTLDDKNTFRVVVPLLTDGKKRIPVVVRDGWGRTAEVTLRLVRDTVAPSIRLDEPKRGTRANADTIDVTGRAFDFGGPIATITVAGEPVTLDAARHFEAEVSLATEGEHAIEVVATDAAGNTFARSVTVTIDRTPPVVTIEAPQATTDPAVTVIVRADEPLLRVNVNGEIQPGVGGDAFTFVDVPVPDSGLVAIVVATDLAGNETRQELRIGGAAPEAPIALIGTRVTRGPDWKWDDQDGGEGTLGTVVRALDGEFAGWVTVVWDGLDSFRYRWGAEDAIDLTLRAGRRRPWIEGFVVRGPDWKWGDQDGKPFSAGRVVEVAVSEGQGWITVTWLENSSTEKYRWNFAGAYDLVAIGEPNALSAGDCVERGTDWKWGDQDGGAGAFGTVVEPVETRGGWVRVQWDSGRREKYRWFIDNAIDLLKVSPERQRERRAQGGATVVRGPDWKYIDQDGGPGARGVVVEASPDRGWVKVRWKASATENSYRFGSDGKFEVRIIPAPGPGK